MQNRLADFMVATEQGVALNIPAMQRGIDVASVVAFIKDHPEIIILSIPMNGVNDAHAADIASIPTLLELNVYGNKITEVGAIHLAKSNLLSLTITNNAIGDKGVAAFASSQLKTLVAANCEISDVGAAAFKDNSTLECLDLSENENITQFHFANNVRLCSVDLRDTQVDKNAETKLPFFDAEEKVPSLQHLCLFALKRMQAANDPNVLGLELTGKQVLVRTSH